MMKTASQCRADCGMLVGIPRHRAVPSRSAQRDAAICPSNLVYVLTADAERLGAALADRYRIERELGAGGMATVYLAADLRHDRKVAIKVLKPELAAVIGAERFVVEIKTTAALQHPHILPLFDSGSTAGHPYVADAPQGRPDGREAAGGPAFLYYVMPYIHGETIREKLNRETQFGVDEAVRIAREVADALDYAHRHGVIHRDIKPENILLHDGRAMVMDFGIALAVSAAAGGRMTETGLSLGTPHYMSPEQATAEKDLTLRSDIYSLASVLYEMLAGEPPHTAGSAQAVIMKIVTDVARPVNELRRNVPPNVSAALSKALEKVPADRFDSAKAFGDALANSAFVTARSGAAKAERLENPWRWSRAATSMATLAGLLAVALGVMVARRSSASVDTQDVVRFALTSDDSLRVDVSTTRPFALSPDGRTIVFRASRDSVGVRLWRRTLGDPVAHPIDGTQNGMNAAFSPNGEWIAFVTENVNIKKVRLSGGSASSVVRSVSRSAALSWGDDDDIFLEQLSDGIHRVAASGGPLVPAIPLDSANNESGQRRPFFLRGTGTIVYASVPRSGGEATLALFRLSDGRRTRLEFLGIGAIGYVEGRLIYSRGDGTLMAVPLDVRAMKATGVPVPLEPRVASSLTGSSVGMSAQGTLVYRAADVGGLTDLALLDTSGQVRPIRGGFHVQGALRFSPDGRRVAIGSRPNEVGDGAWSATLGEQNVQVLDLNTHLATRLRTSGHALYLSWSADGGQLVAPKRDGDTMVVMTVPLDGAAESRLAAFSASAGGAASSTPDGRSLVYGATLPGGANVIYRVWLDGSGRLDTLVLDRRDRIVPFMPRVSPDGRLMAFLDRTTGDVYVQSLTGGGALQVSSVTAGYRRPVVWGPDSRSLYYGGGNGLNIVHVEMSPALRVVDRIVKAGFPIGANYDLAPDGKTFIVVNPNSRDAGVEVAVNWLAEARRRWSVSLKK